MLCSPPGTRQELLKPHARGSANETSPGAGPGATSLPTRAVRSVLPRGPALVSAPSALFPSGAAGYGGMSPCRPRCKGACSTEREPRMRTHAADHSSGDRDRARAASAPRPAALPPLLGLQRSAGNAAVARAIQRARLEPGAAGQEEQQGDPAVQRSTVPDAVASPWRPLEPRILQRAEQAYGMDFGHVRVHSGPDARRSAEDL